MATRFYSREEVLNHIFEDQEDMQEDSETDEVDDEVAELDKQKDALEEWVATYPGGKGFDQTFFRENAMQVLLPIVRHSFVNENTDEDNGIEKKQELRGMLI